MPDDYSPRPAFASPMESEAKEVFRLVERLLAFTQQYQDVERPREALDRFARRLAEAFDADAELHPPEADVRTETNELELPITMRAQRVASLAMKRERPFSEGERELVRSLVPLVGDWLTNISQRVGMQALTDVTLALAVAQSIEEGAEAALDAVLRHAEVPGAALLLDRNGVFEVLARRGAWREGVLDARFEELARACVEAEQPIAQRDSVVTYRLGRERPFRYVILFHLGAPDPLWTLRVPMTLQLGEAIAPHLEALWREQVNKELLRFHGSSGDQAAASLYEQLLDEAIRLVHGADSGSLLVRRATGEPLVFQAVRGFEDDALLGSALADDDAQAWWGADDDGWRRGKARILRADEADLASRSSLGSDSQKGVGWIRSTLCLPVSRDGELMAVMNVDNQHDVDAFGDDSLAIMNLFGPSLADLLHRQHVQDLLREMALTDPLTGLHNRRPLMDALERELARHTRTGSLVTVLVMDLQDFKGINDDHGHDMGDEALARVAKTLQTHVRDTDVVARWGGDEFAAVLVDTPADQAAEAARRLREAVSRLDVRGRRLALNVGAATAPDDGTEEDALIRCADQRMYENKRLAKSRR